MTIDFYPDDEDRLADDDMGDGYAPVPQTLLRRSMRSSP